MCQFNLQIRKGLRPVSLHAIDSAWSLLVCVGSGEGEGGGWLEKRYLGKREGAVV